MKSTPAYRSILVLAVFTHLVHWGRADYCKNSLAAKSCPNLATYDTLDLQSYGGKWYEAGSSANFKNVFEAGGVCAESKYTIEKASEIKMESSFFLSASPGATVAVGAISGSCAAVCQQARAICSQVNADDSLLRKGIAKVWQFKNDNEGSFSSEAALISTANAKIQSAADELPPKMDVLANYVSQIHIENSKMSQTDGDASSSVSTLKSIISSATALVTSVDASYKAMSDGQLDLIKVAESMFKKGGSAVGPSFTLTDAATEILGGVNIVKAQVESMSVSFAAATKSGDAVLEDKSKPYYNVTKFEVTAAHNSSTSSEGKLSLSFDPILGKLFPANYWILAVDGDKSSGYKAALVYSCMEVLTGGIDESLWILSRSPSVSEAVSKRFTALAASLGISQECHAPFVNTLRSSKCPAT